MGLSAKVTIQGARALQRRLGKLNREVEKQKRIALTRGAQQVVKFWKLALSGPRGPTRLGVRTGRLRNSIVARRVGTDMMSVGTKVRYARIHEFGGVIPPHGIIMPKRPHRAVAIKTSRPIVFAIFRGRFHQAYKASKQVEQRISGAQRVG